MIAKSQDDVVAVPVLQVLEYVIEVVRIHLHRGCKGTSPVPDPDHCVDEGNALPRPVQELSQA